MSACPISSRASVWCPSCCRTTPRPRRCRQRCSRCGATRRRGSGRSRGFTNFITCCARIRPKRPRKPCWGYWKRDMDSVLVCGVDEAGRGPLAGPVYAGAVILDKKRRINGLADSKVLAAERRDVLAGRIKERAIAWAVASATVEEIDRINIFHASMLAMRRAVQALGVQPEEAWV